MRTGAEVLLVGAVVVETVREISFMLFGVLFDLMRDVLVELVRNVVSVVQFFFIFMSCFG